MREEVTFRSVTTREEFEKVKEFAKTDGHKLTDTSPPFPVITIWRGDKMFGYLHIIDHPIVIPAFNKKVCSKRDFVDASKKITAWLRGLSKSQRFPEGTGFLGLPPKITICNRIMNKLGYHKTDINLWQFVNWEIEH